MAAYFNLNNNEISKELLVKKFNMILDNQGRLVLNNQKISAPHNEPQRSPWFVQKQPPEVFCKKKVLLKRDSNTGVSRTSAKDCFYLFDLKILWEIVGASLDLTRP